MDSINNRTDEVRCYGFKITEDHIISKGYYKKEVFSYMKYYNADDFVIHATGHKYSPAWLTGVSIEKQSDPFLSRVLRFEYIGEFYKPKDEVGRLFIGDQKQKQKRNKYHGYCGCFMKQMSKTVPGW